LKQARSTFKWRTLSQKGLAMLNLREHPRRTRLDALVILTLACVISLPTRASVVFVARNSSISTVVCGASCSADQITDTTFDSFSQSLGTQNSTGYASQQSTLSQSEISVTLQATQGTFYDETANAMFSVTFDVTTPTAFQLSGSGYYMYGSANSSILFNGPPCSIYAYPLCSDSYSNGNTQNFWISQPGTLQPGEYTLTVDAAAGGPPYMGDLPFAQATAQLSLTPVPLPASGVLLATGLLFFMFLRSRHSSLRQLVPS
jgi:hypothetical protein